MAEFVEVQTYGWLFNTIAAVIAITSMAFLWRYTDKKLPLLLGACPFLLLMGYFMTEKLETRIDAAGIHYRMFPVQNTERNISWGQISRAYVQDNIAYSRKVISFDVYSINDKYGLYIFLTDGTKVIIGTKRPAAVHELLHEFSEHR